MAVWFLQVGLAFAAPAPTLRPDEASWVHLPDPPTPLLEHHRFRSPTLGTDVGFQLYLPPGYPGPGTNRFPVLYWLHERDGSEARPTLDPALVDDAIRRRILPPLLVVYPFAGTNSWYVDSSARAMPAESLLLHELIPHLDRTWRTFAHRDGRLVQGFGMGGFGALRLAVKHPDVFAAAVGYAPELPSIDALTTRPEWSDVFRTAFGGDFLRVVTQHPASVAKGNAEKLRNRSGLRLVAPSAALESDGVRELRETLRVAKVPAEYAESAADAGSPKHFVTAEALAGLEFAVSWLGSARAIDRDGPWSGTPTNRVPRVRHHVVFSETLARPIGYSLYLPPGQETRGTNAPSLPVIYHLPSRGDDENRHTELTGYLDSAVRLGAVPPVAWVWLNGGRTAWYTDDTAGLAPVERVLLTEVIPGIEQRWRLGGGGRRRALDGWGTGGWGALRLLAWHPDLFAGAVVHNAALPDLASLPTVNPEAWFTVLGADPVRFAATEPVAGFTRNAARFSPGPRLRVVVGEQGGRLEDARRLRAALTALNLPHEYQELPREGGLKPGLFHVTGLADLQFLARLVSAPESGGSRSP